VKIDSFCTEQAQQRGLPAWRDEGNSENGMARGAMKRDEIDDGAAMLATRSQTLPATRDCRTAQARK